MQRKCKSGVSIVEFSFALTILIPLLLGTVGVGLNMVAELETAQLARDAGHLFAKDVDFSQAGNKTILTTIGADLGLSATAGSGKAVVVLSSVKYVDKGVCTGFGLVDAGGNPSGCTNYQKWVFVQRLIIGNSSLHSSNLGSPVTTGSQPVTLDPTTGLVTPDTQEATNPGDVAVFSGLNPFVVAGNLDQLPSGQVIYVAEAAARVISMPPFAPGGLTYSYTMF